MGIRFITPETVTLPLSDGDSITIHKKLSHGERDAMYARIRDGKGKDARAVELAAYLVRWSAPMPYKPEQSEDERTATVIDVINGLDEDSFDEIYGAVKAHVKSLQEKKLPSGENESVPTSPSVGTTTGATSGSEPLPQMSTMSS